MGVKSTIKYGPTTIINQFMEDTNNIIITYKGNTIYTLTAGTAVYLNTQNSVCTDYIQIGSKTLNVKDKLLLYNLECIATGTGPESIQLNTFCLDPATTVLNLETGG